MSEYIVSVPDELAEEFESHIKSKQATLFGFKLSDEIIRCADCIHAHDKADSGYWCNLVECRMQPGDYCSWARRGKWSVGREVAACHMHTWHYLCDTCKYADSDGAGRFMCLDYVSPECGGEWFGPIADKLPIPDCKEPHELCLSWEVRQ